MKGDIIKARSLRNQVNRATAKLKFELYQTRIEAMHESGTKNWWENMKTLMGQKTTDMLVARGRGQWLAFGTALEKRIEYGRIRHFNN